MKAQERRIAALEAVGQAPKEDVRHIVYLDGVSSGSNGPTKSAWMVGGGNGIQRDGETDDAFTARVQADGVPMDIGELPYTPEGRIDAPRCTDKQLSEVLNACRELKKRSDAAHSAIPTRIEK